MHTRSRLPLTSMVMSCSRPGHEGHHHNPRNILKGNISTPQTAQLQLAFKTLQLGRLGPTLLRSGTQEQATMAFQDRTEPI